MVPGRTRVDPRAPRALELGRETLGGVKENPVMVRHESCTTHESNLDWEKDRLLCCLDILGFKSKIKSLTIKQKQYRYVQLMDVIKGASHSFTDFPGSSDPSYKIPRAQYYWFSDTFLIFSDPLDQCLSFGDKSAVDFFQAVKIAFLRFLADGYPVRGGIAFGQFIFDRDRNVCLGNTLIDAYETGENQNWAGIALSPKLGQNFFNQFPESKEFIVEYDVPIKCKKIRSRYAIDWPSDYSIQVKSSSDSYITEKFKQHGVMNERAEEMCANTIKFARSRLGSTKIRRV
jgi:hypothetical protein